jgi:peptidoglycan biosynthesis protein MviN/MurJ (putative lipid II flippase)
MFRIGALFKHESYKKGFLLSTVLNIFTKTILFLFNLLIAYYFGASGTTDLLFFSISFSALIASLFSALNSSILIPESMRLREQQSTDAFKSFLTAFLFLYLVISLLLSIIVFAKPAFFYSIFSKFSPELLEKNVVLLRLSVLLIPLLTINTLLLDILSACKLFSVAIVISCFNAILSVIFVYISHIPLGVYCVLISMLFSNVLQILVVLLFLKIRMNWKIKPDFSLLHQKLLQNIVSAQIGNFFSMTAAYYPIYLLSKYENGTLTSLNYGQKIVDIITLFLIIQFSTVFGIKLNETYAQKRNNEIESIFSRSSNLLLFCTIPVCFFIFVYSTEICLLLFKRGNFSYESARNAATFVKFLIISLPLIGQNALNARLFMAAQKINVSVYFQIGTSIFTIIIIHVFVAKFGPVGYPYGLFISYLVGIVSVSLLINAIIKDVNYFKALSVFLFIILLNLPIFISLTFLKSKILSFGTYSNMLAGGIFYLSVLLILNVIFRLNQDVFQFTRLFFQLNTIKKVLK